MHCAKILLPLAGLVFCVASQAAEVVLVDDGRARAAVYVAPRVMAADAKAGTFTQPADRERETQRQRLRESVRDLVHYLEKMSGAKIEVVAGPPPANDDRTPLLIGEFAEQAFGAPKTTYPYKQGFRLVVSPRGLGFVGESDLAVSYAIYELLDRFGCRWYMPGELGEVVPTLKTIRVEEVDFSSAPGTIYRGIWYADDAYRRRNRHGGLLLNAGHALEGYISKEEREQHPEWRAEVEGKPHPTRLKWSKPGVADAMAARIIANLDKSYVPSVSLSPDDGLGYDETDDLKLDAGDFDPTFQGISITDRLIVLANQIAERVTKKHPDVLFGMLAYANYTRPPVREKLHPSIVPQMAPITYSRAHPMTGDEVPGNKELRYLIERWGQAAKTTSVYFYGWFLAEPSAPNPMIAKWSTDVPIVFRNNCKFWQPETMPNFETSMHGLYLGCRLAWNPQLDPAAIIAELNTNFYGHAAREMTAYWSFIDDVWVKTPDYSGCGFGYMGRWTPERLARARELLDAALAACATTTELHRVRLADESLELFELFMKLRRDQAEGRFADLASNGEFWMKKAALLGEKYQDNFTFTRTSWRATTVNASYFRAFYQHTYADASRIAAETTILTPTPLVEFRYQADEMKTGEAQGWAAADFDDAAWKTTDVTRETWSTIGYHDWFKSMWYRTEVKLPAAPKSAAGKRIYLWLGGTDGSAKVFVNGKHIPYVDAKGTKLDEFNDYCKPASWDITDAVTPGDKVKIAILCTRTFFNELGTGGLLAPAVVYREK